MIAIPATFLTAAQADGTLDALLEWRLDTQEVGTLLGASPRTVRLWVREGRKGIPLRARAFRKGIQRTGEYAYRLQDVESFASHFGWNLDYGQLPLALQREYQVGEFVLVDPVPGVTLEEVRS